MTALEQLESTLETLGLTVVQFREHYNQQRPHSALADRTPVTQICVDLGEQITRTDLHEAMERFSWMLLSGRTVL